MIKEFTRHLVNHRKSENTIKGYVQSVNGVLKWYDESKGISFLKLHQEDIIEYIYFFRTINLVKPKTINTKLNALMKFK